MAVRNGFNRNLPYGVGYTQRYNTPSRGITAQQRGVTLDKLSFPETQPIPLADEEVGTFSQILKGPSERINDFFSFAPHPSQRVKKETPTATPLKTAPEALTTGNLDQSSLTDIQNLAGIEAEVPYDYTQDPNYAALSGDTTTQIDPLDQIERESQFADSTEQKTKGISDERKALAAALIAGGLNFTQTGDVQKAIKQGSDIGFGLLNRSDKAKLEAAKLAEKRAKEAKANEEEAAKKANFYTDTYAKYDKTMEQADRARRLVTENAHVVGKFDAPVGFVSQFIKESTANARSDLKQISANLVVDISSGRNSEEGKRAFAGSQSERELKKLSEAQPDLSDGEAVWLAYFDRVQQFVEADRKLLQIQEAYDNDQISLADYQAQRNAFLKTDPYGNTAIASDYDGVTKKSDTEAGDRARLEELRKKHRK